MHEAVIAGASADAPAESLPGLVSAFRLTPAGAQRRARRRQADCRAARQLALASLQPRRCARMPLPQGRSLSTRRSAGAPRLRRRASAAQRERRLPLRRLRRPRLRSRRAHRRDRLSPFRLDREAARHRAPALAERGQRHAQGRPQRSARFPRRRRFCKCSLEQVVDSIDRYADDAVGQARPHRGEDPRRRHERRAAGARPHPPHHRAPASSARDPPRAHSAARTRSLPRN